MQFPVDQPAQDFFGDEAGGLDLWRYIDIVRRRWVLVTTILGVFLAAGILTFFLLPRRYSSVVTLQITRMLSLPTGYGALPWNEEVWDEGFYPTQHRLLRSRGLAERVVGSLRLNERRAFDPPRSRWWGSEKGTVSAGDDEIEVGRLAVRLLESLKVLPIPETHLVQVRFESPSADLAAEVANSLAEEFISWGREQQGEVVGEASKYLNQQIDALQEDLKERRTRMESFTEGQPVIVNEAGISIELQRLRSLNEDYVQALGESIRLQGEHVKLQSVSDELLAQRLSGGMVTRLKEQMLKLELDYASNLEIYKPEWPSMVDQRIRIQEGRTRLEETIQTIVKEARRDAAAEALASARRKDQLENEIDKVQQGVRSANSSALEYGNLEVEVETRRDLLDQLLRLRSEAELAVRLQSSKESNVRVVERALLPQDPVYPVLQIVLAWFAAMGFLVAGGCVVVLESTNQAIRTPEELERVLGVQVLGAVANYEDGEPKRNRRPRRRGSRTVDPEGGGIKTQALDLLAHSQPRHPLAEAYRSLASALLFSGGRSLKVAAVTSAEPGEGKTTTVCNLAITLTQLGRRVVVVDADLRRPRLDRVFGVRHRGGLVDYIKGDRELDAVISKTTVPGLDLLPAGPPPENPWGLLVSARMSEVIVALRQRYDFVLLDTPPLMAVSDSFFAGRIVDGVLLCFQAERIVPALAMTCVEQLQRREAHILGVTLNRVRPFGGNYYYAGLYYSAPGSSAYQEDVPKQVRS